MDWGSNHSDAVIVLLYKPCFCWLIKVNNHTHIGVTSLQRFCNPRQQEFIVFKLWECLLHLSGLFFTSPCPARALLPKVLHCSWQGFPSPSRGLVSPLLGWTVYGYFLIWSRLSHKLLHWWLAWSHWPTVWCSRLLPSQLFFMLCLCGKWWLFIVWTCPYWIYGASETSGIDLSSRHIVPVVNSCYCFYRWSSLGSGWNYRI